MRKFAIICDGTRIELNGESGIALYNPTGLGTSFGDSFAEIADGFYAQTMKKGSQGSVTGDLLIHADANGPYSHYETFINQILNAEKLVLVYTPVSTDYYADVAVNFVNKEEALQDKAIVIPISLKLLSMWYTEQTLTGTGSVSVTHAGQIASAVKITTTGTALTNPVISMSDSNGVFAKAKITKEITAAQTLEYQNYYDDSHIILRTAGEADEDLIPATNIANAVFGKIKANYTITVTDDNDATPAISVTVRRYWRTV